MSDVAPPGRDAAEALRHLCFSDPVFRERYQGFEVVGQGAYSSVAVSRLMGCPVALKIFTHLSDEGRARFRTEFASALRVTSPHAVRTYSAFERGPLCWIEMEAVFGTTLKEELERRRAQNRPFTLAQGVEIGLAVAAVLAEAHAAGIVHRDVKPANILLPGSGQPAAKLSDFGVARIAGGARLTATGAFPGTPHYGAPEAFAGREVGPPADIYSFSLCLYAVFTNNAFPWQLGEKVTLEGLVTSHVRRLPRPMRSIDPALPEALDALILEGLDKQPQRRPTAALMAERLARIPCGVPPPAPRRRRFLPAVVAGGILLGVPASRVAPEGAGTVGHLAPFAISLEGDRVRLTNGPEPLRDVEVAVVSEGGGESRVPVPGGLGGGETAELALDAFPPPRTGPVKALRVRGHTPGGRSVESRLELAPPREPF
jgi:hypothetical protein